MAFRLKYNSLFVFIEVTTVFAYGTDIYYRVKNLYKLRRIGGNMPNSEKLYEKTMMDNIEHFNKRIVHLKIEIATSALAIVPFSFIF
jgi:hypothetical protein